MSHALTLSVDTFLALERKRTHLSCMQSAARAALVPATKELLEMANENGSVVQVSCALDRRGYKLTSRPTDQRATCVTAAEM